MCNLTTKLMVNAKVRKTENYLKLKLIFICKRKNGLFLLLSRLYLVKIELVIDKGSG